jgi:hypothetical protein
MKNYHNQLPDDALLRLLEIKATRIRKLLLGSLLVAKDAWKDVLLGTPEGLRVLKTVEEAEEEFIDTLVKDSGSAMWEGRDGKHSDHVPTAVFRF